MNLRNEDNPISKYRMIFFSIFKDVETYINVPSFSLEELKA